MTRGERRTRTDKIAKRRFNKLKHHTNLLRQFGADLDLPTSEGYFKKANGFSNKKESSRLWRKIEKRKQQTLKDNRRNGSENYLSE